MTDEGLDPSNSTEPNDAAPDSVQPADESTTPDEPTASEPTAAAARTTPRDLMMRYRVARAADAAAGSDVTAPSTEPTAAPDMTELATPASPDAAASDAAAPEGPIAARIAALDAAAGLDASAPSDSTASVAGSSDRTDLAESDASDDAELPAVTVAAPFGPGLATESSTTAPDASVGLVDPEIVVAAAAAARPTDSAADARVPTSPVRDATTRLAWRDVPIEPASTVDGDAADKPSRRTRLAVAARRWAPTAIGVAIAIGVVVLLVRTGFTDDYNNTLQVMGFDPDRATLLISLLLGAIAALLVTVVGGRMSVAVLTGAGVVGITFYSTFREETRQALASKGADGTFDPIGWAISALTLLTVGLVAGWAAAVLGRDIASRLVVLRGAAGDVAIRRTRARMPRAASHLLVAGLAVAILAVTLPVFGDMLNFDPDSHMRQGAPAGVSLFGGNPGGDNGGTAAGGAGTGTGGTGTTVDTGTGASASPDAGGTHHSPTPTSPLVIPASLVAGPVSGSYVTAGVLGTARPWAKSPPQGGGRTLSVNLPPPWTGGIRDYATIDIYLPPGYDQGTQRYPVIYEPHQPLWAWEQGMHVSSLLDTLIRSGAMPPEIVVFVGQYGGPYADSECADSFDGKEWFDRYLGQDVPNYMDSHYRTIATPAARALLGFSSGGYCAAAALSHHPDVFSTAMIFSGYFQAGVKSSTTPTAGRPYNDNPALEAQVSPINVLPQLPATQRTGLFVTFSADPANHFYGDQITAFAGVLAASNVPIGILPTPLGHSWAAVREQLPDVLALLAARQVKLGVFKTS
jgi:enterochelin esterase-like enzyme